MKGVTIYVPKEMNELILTLQNKGKKKKDAMNDVVNYAKLGIELEKLISFRGIFKK